MKLTVELDNETFGYSYEIGSSRQSGSTPLSADDLCCFVDMLRLCLRDSNRKINTFKEEVVAMAMLEKDPELVKKFVKKHKN